MSLVMKIGLERAELADPSQFVEFLPTVQEMRALAEFPHLDKSLRLDPESC
jgi:hypothetical protein